MLDTSIYHQELNGLAISVIRFRSNKKLVREAFFQPVSTKPISMNYYSPLSVTELEPTLEQRM